jgi:hypothetical protein
MLLVILVLLCAPRQTVPRTTAASGHSDDSHSLLLFPTIFLYF